MSAIVYCDRCGAEMFNASTLRIAFQITDSFGREVWQICESCSVELRHVIEDHPKPMKRVSAYASSPPCSVCGGRAPYEHEGKRYCVKNECQLVASGMISRSEARKRLLRKRVKR